MTKTVTLVAAGLLALASVTAAQASIPPSEPPASEAQTDAKAQAQTNDKVALMPRGCNGC